MRMLVSDRAPWIALPPVPLPLAPARLSDPMSRKFSALVAVATFGGAELTVTIGFVVMLPIRWR